MANEYGKDLFENLIRIVNKFSQLNQIPRDFGVDIPLSPAEIHVVDAIGNHPGIHVGELAEKKGVTTGAVSQILKKLEQKELVIREKEPGNRKTVQLNLTTKGAIVFHQFQAFKLKLLAGFWETFDERLQPDQMALLTRFGKKLEQYVDSLLHEKKFVLRAYRKTT